MYKYTIMTNSEISKEIAEGKRPDMDWNTPCYKREFIETSKSVEELESELSDNIIHSHRYGEVKRTTFSERTFSYHLG